MNKLKIKRNDKVKIISGKDKGKTSVVISVNPKAMKVVVKDVNIATCHKKPTQFSQGGIVKKEMPMHISNVMLYDESAQKPSRVGYRIENGVKTRFYKTSGKDVVSN